MSILPIGYNLIIVILSTLILFNLLGIEVSACDYVLTEYDMFQARFYTISETIFTLLLGVLCYRLNLCAYNWYSVASLLMINIINLFGCFAQINWTVYSFLYSNILILALTTLSIILYLRNKKNAIHHWRQIKSNE